jgi:endonuclease/exonuclease/phosphatase (EEP) superfamily protein YafD
MGPLAVGFLGLALVTFLAALGGALGFLWPGLDFLSHLAPIWVGCAVLCLLASRIQNGRLKFATIALSAASLAAAFVNIAPEALMAKVRDEGSDPQALRLIQFNVWGRNVDADRTIDWILAQSADVVIIEEGFGDSWRVNKRLRKAYPNWSSCALPDYCEVMIFSRAPMLERGAIRQPRGAWAVIDWRGTRVPIVGVHYPWPYPAGPVRSSMPSIKSPVEGELASNLVIAGDFNATPWSYALREQDKGLAVPRRTRGIMSYPAQISVGPFNVPMIAILPIDHLYAGEAWRTEKIRRGPRLGSDHYPIIIDLARGPAKTD